MNQESPKLTRKERFRIQKEKALLRLAGAFNILLFSLVLVVVGVLSLALPKPTVSEYEKRELATKPEFSVSRLFAGSYVRELELYYADTFPLRDGFVRLASGFDELKGLRFDGVRIHGTVPVAEEPTEQNAQQPWTPENPAVEAQEPDADEYRPHVVEDDGAEGEQLEGIFIYKDKALAIFGGSSTMKDRYAQALNGFHAELGDAVTVYDMIIPTQIEFALPERYKSITVSQRDNIDYIYGQLNGVVGVDAYSLLETHADEYIYFRTDHHWTGLGAYYAYRAYAREAGFEPLELEEYEMRSIPDFWGTLYAQTNDSKLKVDQVDYYLPPEEEDFHVVRYQKNAPGTPVEQTLFANTLSTSNAYSVFLHGDYPLIQIDTGLGNGRSVVVVKESFGNAFAPYLTSHYEQVFVVDGRYFEQDLIQFIRDNQVDDLIFLNNSFSANTGYHVENLEALLGSYGRGSAVAGG